jgi:hypothetical protein
MNKKILIIIFVLTLGIVLPRFFLKNKVAEVSDTSEEFLNSLPHDAMYYLRGVNLIEPKRNNIEVNGSFKIKGNVGNDLYMKGVEVAIQGPDHKGTEQESVFIPLDERGDFEKNIQLTLGPGWYNITIYAPKIEKTTGDEGPAFDIISEFRVYNN